MPYIGKRTKWFQKTKDIAVEEVVVVVSSETPRRKWPLSKITHTYPGEDGDVRAVKYW